MAERDLPPGVRVVDPHAPTYEGYYLHELLERPELLEPPTAIIARFLWAGRLTMVAGTDKVGKSTLARQLTAAITTGSWCLGDQANGGVPANVCWIGLEEALGDMVLPLASMKPDPRRVLIVPNLLGNKLQAVRDALASGQFVVLIIDTLIALEHACEVYSERDEMEMTALLQELKAIARSGVAVLVLHHHTRPSESGGGRERGSGAIPAVCDVVINLNARKGEAGVLDVSSRGRAGMGGQPFALRQEDGRFTLADASIAPVAAIVKQADEVWHYLRHNPNVSVAEIAVGLKIRRATVFDILTELEREGRAKNTSARANRPAWIATVPEFPSVPGTVGNSRDGVTLSTVPTVPPPKGGRGTGNGWETVSSVDDAFPTRDDPAPHDFFDPDA